jgi:hypothetical protein
MLGRERWPYLLELRKRSLRLLLCRLPQPATASPTPGAGCFSHSMACQGRAGGWGKVVGARSSWP